jgi:hypothetical protein
MLEEVEKGYAVGTRCPVGWEELAVVPCSLCAARLLLKSSNSGSRRSRSTPADSQQASKSAGCSLVVTKLPSRYVVPQPASVLIGLLYTADAHRAGSDQVSAEIEPCNRRFRFARRRGARVVLSGTIRSTRAVPRASAVVALQHPPRLAVHTRR